MTALDTLYAARRAWALVQMQMSIDFDELEAGSNGNGMGLAPDRARGHQVNPTQGDGRPASSNTHPTTP